MGLFTNKTARRREVRRNIQKPRPQVSQWLGRPGVGYAIGYIVMLTILGGLLVVVGRSNYGYYPNKFIEDTIIARTAFEVENKAKTLENRREAKLNEPAVFVANTKFFDTVRDHLQGLIQLAADPAIKSIDQVPAETQEKLLLDRYGLEQLQTYYLTDGEPNELWHQQVDRFINELANTTIITPEDSVEAGTKIFIQHPSGDELPRFGDVLFLTTKEHKFLEEYAMRLAAAFPNSNQFRDSIVVAAIPDSDEELLQPTYLFDEEQTRLRKQAAYQRDDNIAIDRYLKDDVLVTAGKKLSSNDLDILQAENLAYNAELGLTGKWLRFFGLATAVLLITVGMWGYIAAYYPRVMEKPMRGLAITAMVLLCQVLAVIVLRGYPAAILPVMTFATLMAAYTVAIAYDQRFALAIGSFNALLVIVSLNLSIGFAMVLLTGVVVTVYQLNDIRTSSKLLLSGLWTGVTMGVTTLVVGLAERPLSLDGVFMRIAIDSMLVFGAALVTGSVVQNFYPLIERVFQITTGMRLKELSDSSLPLLRRLAQDAPGTYQHSLRLADMAEAAAQSIGANSLLCRVGAMYHDIGKINKPEYFVENQRGGPNRHSKLSPAMSLLIIIGHVKDGMEMAKEYGLPKPLRHFIESHHGTTLVEYFFHAAKQLSDENSEAEPEEFEFRYPGPKPQTKEAAILMLCDSTESATRAQTEPTPARIEQVVHGIASKRLMDGQFDECNLTLEELHKIEQSAIKTLCAIYHGRISYPSEKKSMEPPREKPVEATTTAVS